MASVAAVAAVSAVVVVAIAENVASVAVSAPNVQASAQSAMVIVPQWKGVSRVKVDARADVKMVAVSVVVAVGAIVHHVKKLLKM